MQQKGTFRIYNLRKGYSRKSFKRKKPDINYHATLKCSKQVNYKHLYTIMILSNIDVSGEACMITCDCNRIALSFLRVFQGIYCYIPQGKCRAMGWWVEGEILFWKSRANKRGRVSRNVRQLNEVNVKVRGFSFSEAFLLTSQLHPRIIKNCPTHIYLEFILNCHHQIFSH